MYYIDTPLIDSDADMFIIPVEPDGIVAQDSIHQKFLDVVDGYRPTYFTNVGNDLYEDDTNYEYIQTGMFAGRWIVEVPVPFDGELSIERYMKLLSHAMLIAVNMRVDKVAMCTFPCRWDEDFQEALIMAQENNQLTPANIELVLHTDEWNAKQYHEDREAMLAAEVTP